MLHFIWILGILTSLIFQHGFADLARVVEGSDVTFNFTDVTNETLEQATKIVFDSENGVQTVMEVTDPAPPGNFVLTEQYYRRISDIEYFPFVSFVLHDISVSDGGGYHVEHGSQRLSSTMIYVFGKPIKPVITSNPEIVQRGATVNLTCQSDMTSLPAVYRSRAQVTWFSTGQVITQNSSYVQEGPALYVPAVHDADTSTDFTCSSREDGSPLQSDLSEVFRIQLSSKPGWGVYIGIAVTVIVVIVLVVVVSYIVYRRKRHVVRRVVKVRRAASSMRQCDPPRFSVCYSIAETNNTQLKTSTEQDTAPGRSSKARDSVWWRGFATLPSMKTFTAGKGAAGGGAAPERSATLRPATGLGVFTRRKRRAIKTMDCTEVHAV